MIVSIISSPHDNVIVLTTEAELVRKVMAAATEAKESVAISKWDTDKDKVFTITVEPATKSGGGGV